MYALYICQSSPANRWALTRVRHSGNLVSLPKGQSLLAGKVDHRDLILSRTERDTNAGLRTSWA
jgi:hypothetical protein